DTEYSNKEVVSGFDKYREHTKNKRVVFFVHGCCAPFQASLERSAKIAAHMQVPLVVFDWTSPNGFTKYLENETLAEQAYDD
ncbi:alpha/beta hydrolase, partial [Vibrio parahaemolyticus]